MNRVESTMHTLDFLLDTKRKRHVTGGILMSVSLLFGGLAITVLLLKLEDIMEDKKKNER